MHECHGVFLHVGSFFTLGFLSDLLAAGGTVMSANTDVVKGRLKEAAGALTGNDDLRAEGKTDQAVGRAKQVAEKAVDKVAKAIRKVRK
jgi:uncharacterized protein YjbJ (UPF0337 family)